jgi:hypothetical protein
VGKDESRKDVAGRALLGEPAVAPNTGVSFGETDLRGIHTFATSGSLRARLGRSFGGLGRGEFF